MGRQRVEGLCAAEHGLVQAGVSRQTFATLLNCFEGLPPELSKSGPQFFRMGRAGRALPVHLSAAGLAIHLHAQCPPKRVLKQRARQCQVALVHGPEDLELRRLRAAPFPPVSHMPLRVGRPPDGRAPSVHMPALRGPVEEEAKVVDRCTQSDHHTRHRQLIAQVVNLVIHRQE